MRLRWRLLRPWLRAVSRVDLATERAQARGRRFLEGLLPGVLTDAELAELSAWSYERRGEPAVEGPFGWESAWLESLPPAPARVLVGGAGYGREARFLHARGYAVRCYDPSPEAVDACRGLGPADVGTHERLVRASEGAAWPLLDGGVDAVWLGWGSLSHVLRPEARAAVLRACFALTEGPVFASARVAEAGAPSPRPGRFHRVGVAAARALGGEPPPPNARYQPEVGFAATLSVEELQDAAERAGRRLALSRHPGITAIAFLG